MSSIPTVYVIVEGGLVQQVEADGAEVRVVVIDYDARDDSGGVYNDDGTLVEGIALLPQADYPERPEPAWVTEYAVGPRADIGQPILDALDTYCGRPMRLLPNDGD